jgi:CheY-like chemotaxis protein
MSHDLRTPLSSILGFSELLMNKANNTEEKQDLEMIHRSAEQLTLLINDLLEISSIEAGETKINFSPVNITELLHEIVRSLQRSAKNKGLSLEIQLDNSLPHLLQTDIKRIRQICANLLTNAIKYTDSGKVQLKATQKTHDSTNNLVIEVLDTGRGVPKEMQKAIFDPFRQVEETNLHPTEGKGLGLAICKNLVHAMNGHIEIESAKGHGSLFRVTLPILQVEEELPNFTPDLKKLSGHILLVEDDGVNQIILERMLEHFGLTITKAENGEVAIKLLKSNAEKYSLILMDCQMPEMDGWKATKLIRNNLKLKTPIIAVTAYAQNEDIQRSIEMGMNDFLVKPLKLQDLHKKMTKHLQSKRD